ncbi:MAG: hypothetical protein H7Z19_23395, partial [Chitinophagaceae bacterium]|nr:hypothetical protein [Rubrivivax sp.]
MKHVLRAAVLPLLVLVASLTGSWAGAAERTLAPRQALAALDDEVIVRFKADASVLR